MMILSNNDHDTDYHDSMHHQEPLLASSLSSSAKSWEKNTCGDFIVYQNGIGEFRLCQKDKGQICNDENIMKL